MALGLCCQWLTVKNSKAKNILISRNLQLGRFQRGEYTAQRIKSTYQANVQNLLDLMPIIIRSGIRSFRVSSSMFSLYDKIDKSFYDNPKIKERLAKIGQLALESNVRLTTHPGQFVVLSSDKAQTVQLAIQDINLHAWIFDQMGLPETPYYSINIHGGKGNRAKQLIAGINRLQPSARARLTLENCEFAYSVKDLLPISEATGVPLCFDSHHHFINPDGLDASDAMEKCLETWPNDIKPNTHLSNPKDKHATSKTKLRSHSDYLNQIPEYQKLAHNKGRIDIDVEAKMKNLAIFAAVKTLGLELAPEQPCCIETT